MSQRALAWTFTLLMLAGAIPSSSATHTNVTPDLPGLPHARPTDQCLPVGLQPEILARVNQAQQGDPAFYQNDVGVPSVCVSGAPLSEWQTLINQADITLQLLRDAAKEIQDQEDYRLEATLPEGQRACGPTALPPTPELDRACEIVGPRTVLLNDTFNGFRSGGFGDWQVVTEQGEDAVFKVNTIDEVNGTRSVYRFGSASGYSQGTHQWLVSPEIDLTAVKGNRTAVSDLIDLRESARTRLHFYCNDFTPSPTGAPPGGGTFEQFCGEYTSNAVSITGVGAVDTKVLKAVVSAYELAFDQTITQLPVMQHGAFVDLTYKYNLAPGEDGVRVWVYHGDRQPDRRALFHPSFGVDDAYEDCIHYARPVNQTVPAPVYKSLNDTLQQNTSDPADRHDLECEPRVDVGGGKVLALTNMTAVTAMKSSHGENRAFTGEQAEFTTIRVNLTDYLEQRIWLLFEVQTNRNDRGIDIFHDPGRFPHPKDFGFQLARVYVEGDAYLRNFRLKDVAATYPYEVAGNEFGDSTTTRAAVPPGNSPVVAWVHNAGDYLENGTLRLDVRARNTSIPGSSFATVGTYNTTVSLRPDEVKTVSVPWGAILSELHPTLRERWLYEVRGRLDPLEAISDGGAVVVGSNSTSVLHQVGDPTNQTLSDPNVTSVRPGNAAGLIPGAGTTDLTQLVRAATLRNITFVRADGKDGVPLQLCSAVDKTSCAELYAGRKGEPRIALIGVRNDGNTAQNITVDLAAYLDGVGKNDIILDGSSHVAREVLPGEIRPMTWTIVATQPGAYRLVASPIRQGQTGAVAGDLLAERRLFVQRSTGLVCLDTLEERECGPSFAGQLVPELRLEDITASAFAPDGTLYVATEIRNASESIHSGQLAARDPMGVWRVAANLSADVLKEKLGLVDTTRADAVDGSIRQIVVAPDSSLYLLGANRTALHWFPTNGSMYRVPLNWTSDENVTSFTSALWYKGTLVAAGRNGTLAYLSNGTMERVLVMSRATTYNGTFRAMAIAPNGAGVLAGDGGVLLRHDNKKNLSDATAWTEARTKDDVLLADALGNATIWTLGANSGRLIVSGVEFAYASATNETTKFTSITLPASAEGPRLYPAIFTSHEGRLYFLDATSRLVTCDGCFDAIPTWTYVTPLRPSIVGKGVLHPAEATQALVGAGQTLLLGEAGMVLSLANRGDYTNMLDWSVVPSLAPHDGGVLQTKRTDDKIASQNAESILFVPNATERAVAQRASQFRLFINHSIPATYTSTGAAQQAHHGEIRLVYRDYPDVQAQAPTCPPDGSDAATTAVRPVCMSDDVRRLVDDDFAKPTPTDGWEFRVYPNLPTAGPVPHPAAGQDPVGAWFYGLEIFVTRDMRWAFDDLRLQGLVDGKWIDVVAWYGPGASGNHGALYVEDLYNAVNVAACRIAEADPACPDGPDGAILLDAPDGLNLQVSPTAAVWEISDLPFDLAVFSPWHATTEYADRPVFAANNEFYKDGWSNPAAPVLLNNWDARLVSPILDLRDVFDPVIAWRQSFAFRTETATLEDKDYAKAGDGGTIEVSYLRRGPDCQTNDVRISADVTCGWSPFYVVTPESGYPTIDRVGFAGMEYHTSKVTGPSGTNEGRLGQDASGVGLSYWGRIALPDETGRISDTRLTETYTPASVRLNDVDCNDVQMKDVRAGKRVDCVPVDLSGHLVRVAFHLQTTGSWTHEISAGHEFGEYSTDNHFNSSVPVEGRSFPGEGWYLTDFKVQGAKTLGINLRATNMSFRVGYDPSVIGVGPGTRVPVNVTVENKGAFEALGYTGRLEVRRVLDRATKNASLIQTIALSQQPVLDANGSVNHTLYWDVPAIEKAEYALRFVLEPIGIARDEDHTDNVAQLGTIARPTLAKTVQRFNVEFLVTPENATSDITRYIPIFLNNTGNVPLEGFTFERRIVAQGRAITDDADTCAEWQAFVLDGRPTAIVDCRQWTTQRAAPAGTLSPLTSLSDQVNPTADLFWKAPERATFVVAVSAKTQIGATQLVSATDRRVAAFATYLFDDVEGGVRGESRSGNWVFGDSWNSTQPGFRSTDAYAFGDAALDRYLPDQNAALVSPTIDLGSARTARIALFHNFAFETGFDGGVIEASDDGGISWKALTPISDKLASVSYNTSDNHQIQPSSVLHPTGDPEQPAYAFTSDSKLAPGNVDGWVLSQVDLTTYANVTESSVEYEAYHASELGRYSLPPTLPINQNSNVFRQNDWCSGAAEDGRCWSVENLTALIPVPKSANDPDNQFWWSGSLSNADDGLRPVQNNLLEFTLDITRIESDRIPIADWWEYSARFNEKAIYLHGEVPPTSLPSVTAGVFSVYDFHTGSVGTSTSRFNVGEPKIVETRGHWFHMQSDLTPIVKKAREQGAQTLKVGFAYTPIDVYSDRIATNEFVGHEAEVSSDMSINNHNTTYIPRYLDDPGFAVDDFSVKAYRPSGGQSQSDAETILDEAKTFEDDGHQIRDCGAMSTVKGTAGAIGNGANWAPANSNEAPCMTKNAAFHDSALPVTGATVLGRNWNIVSEIPAQPGTWRVVSVKDHNGKSPTNPLPTGDVPKAWYTGDLLCRENLNTNLASHVDPALCPRRGADSRLVSPAFDLARIAGEDAQLSFWHRFAFAQRLTSGDAPLASGGAVEISVYDAQTNTWSAWKQLYSNETFDTGGNTTPGFYGRGGYTGWTSNTTVGGTGVRRFDPPFENLRVGDVDRAVQFLFTGSSKTIEEKMTTPDGDRDGWLRASYDLHDYLGRKVRFGFHYEYSQLQLGSQELVTLPSEPTSDQPLGGWWISDIGIVGDVLIGKPVQLRFRAGSDGNVQDGHWVLDDIGVFGARYHNNVGLFVDPTENAFGAYANTVTEVPVTLRNMGDTVRRDLALEVRVVGDSGVSVSGLGPGGNVTDGGKLTMKGYTLGPGQSAVAMVKVRTPKTFGATASVQLLFQLKEANPSPTQPFGVITDNEVQGLLSRLVDFKLQRAANVTLLTPLIRQVTPALGQPVDYVVPARNDGFGPVTVELNCTARTITDYQDVQHTHGAVPVDQPVVAATYPCAISGKMTLASKESTNYTFRATPTQVGFLSFVPSGRIVGEGPLGISPGGVPIGVPTVAYRETFDTKTPLNNYSGSSTGFSWSHTRGHDALGALMIGANESSAGSDYRDQNSCAGSYCYARTPLIDLHNFSLGTPAYLSFYHMDRFARFDGAQVRVQMLENEAKPNSEQSWSAPCILRPVSGQYEGTIRQKPPVAANTAQGTQADAGDPNTAFGVAPYSTHPEFNETAPDFFVSKGGIWEEAWSLAVFNLDQRCPSVQNAADNTTSIVGHTVRFEFDVFPGAVGALRRGPGQGMVIDEISISPSALEVRPASGQKATLLDNTTKSFNLLVKNLGSMPDIISFGYDAINSSAPEGSIRVPTGTITLQPKEQKSVPIEVKLPRDPSLLPTDFKARVLARSVLDPNAAGSTTLDLSFAPRQWAELGLTVDAPLGIVQEATETFIPITVENAGLIDSVATRVKIVDTWANGRAETTLDLASIPSYAQSPEEALRVLEYRWRPERGSIGEHTLTFEVDPEALGEEYTRANNVATIHVTVSDLLIPDLTIGNFSALTLRNSLGGTVTPGFDADVARYEVTAGEVVSFELKVKNVGRAGATNVDVRAFIGALSLPPKTIPYIAPGSEVALTFHWLAQKGEHEIEFLVRSEQVEISSANNRYPGTGVTILTVKGYEIAIDIPAIDGVLSPASELRVPFSISNNGNAGEDLVLRATSPPGTHLQLPREGFFLRAGETYSDHARLILDAEAVAGAQFITIDAVARENPLKVASGRAAMSVLASYGGSVAGGYAVGAPPQLVLPVEIVNEGNSLEPWKVTLRLPAGWTSKETMPASVVVPAHDRLTYNLHVTLPETTAPGDRVIAVKAEMANGAKREGVVHVNVLPLRAASVTVTAAAPKPDHGELSIPIVVQNTGNVQQPFSLLMVDQPAGAQIRVEPSEFLLPPGGEAVATLRVKPNATMEAGTYAVTGYTSFAGVIPQTREGLANVQTLQVPIVRQDLKITTLDFAPRAQLGVGDRVSVKATLVNSGHSELTNVPVHLFVDDVFVGEALVPTIPAGGRTDVSFNWTAITGVHTLTAVLDPYEDTVDANREDNAVSALATVGVDVPTGGLAAGRADTPMGGVALLVLAAIGAALVLTRKDGSRRRERR